MEEMIAKNLTVVNKYWSVSPIKVSTTGKFTEQDILKCNASVSKIVEGKWRTFLYLGRGNNGPILV